MFSISVDDRKYYYPSLTVRKIEEGFRSHTYYITWVWFYFYFFKRIVFSFKRTRKVILERDKLFLSYSKMVDIIRIGH